jgi:hypothetical protein
MALEIEVHPGSEIVKERRVRDCNRFEMTVPSDWSPPVLTVSTPDIEIDIYCVDAIAAMRLSGMEVTWKR